MAAVLFRAAMMESRVFALHGNADSGLAVLSLAYNLSMTSGGYVWIATDWLSSVLDSSPRRDMGLLSIMQGVLTLRHHTQNTRRKKILASEWSALVKGGTGGRFLINSYGLYTYDTVWIIAHALDAFFRMGGNIAFSHDPKLHEAAGGALNFEALSILDGGRLLLDRIRQVNFTGATDLVTFDSYAAFPRDSPMAVELSTAILSLSEKGDLQRITDKWLTSGSSADALDADRLHVQSFAALFLICGVACLPGARHPRRRSVPAVRSSRRGVGGPGRDLRRVAQYAHHVAESADPAAISAGSRSHRSSLR